MSKRLLTRCIYLLSAVFILAVFPVTAAAEEPEDPRVLTVAFPESPGINEVYEDGTFGGCVYDWLQEIAKYTGWEYEIVTGDGNELIHDMMAGQYDLMGGMFKNPQIEEYFNYPKYIMGSNYSLLIYRRDDQSIKQYDYTTMNGKRIGVLRKATAKIERLEKFLDFNNIQCELVYYDDSKEYENCLETDKVDLLLGNDIYMKDHYNVAAKFSGEPYYIITPKADPELCEELSWAMEQVYAANPAFAEQLYDKYFPDKYINSITFTDQELSYIKERGTLKVAVLRDRYPLFYMQEDGTKGMVPQCLALVAERTGISFEYVLADTYQEMLDMALAGEADLVGSFMDNDASAKSLGLIRVSEYARLDSVILRDKRRSSTGPQVMAVPKGRTVKPLSDEDTAIYYSGYQECINAINSNDDVDYTIMPAAFVDDYYSKDYYANILLIADTGAQVKFSLALPQRTDAVLYSILSKAVNNISADETVELIANNTMIPRNNAITLKSLIYTNPVMFLTICIGFILLIFMIIFLISRYKMRTKMIRLELNKAVETSKTKSEFLSRMSHEIRTPMNAIIGLTNLIRMSGGTTPEVDQNLGKIHSSANFLLSLLNDVLDMSKIDSNKMKIERVPLDLEKMVLQTESMLGAQAKEKGISLEVSCLTESPHVKGDRMRLQQVLTNLLSNACKFTDKGGSVWMRIEERERSIESVTLRFSVKDNGIGIQPEDMERIFYSFEQAKNSNLRASGTGLGLAISSHLVSLMGGELKVDSKPGIGSEFYFTIKLPVCTEPIADENDAVEIEEEKLRGLHVLLAEDNDLNAEIAVSLMEIKGITVDRAIDGQKAVELFKESPPSTYNVILMDINMPIKNGLAATMEIRALARPDAATVPILAMTANTFQEDQESAAKAGMTGFLPKPFDIGQLYRLLLDAKDSVLRK
ncbi:ATP-binding protein [Blautia pseudococcoides]|nr:transporter substrate-binding domain-containing protein [Blautia pseudococcoides]QQQ93345.1 transporter substrate-binding domain-containing protein [Blautia pseudococcoides]